MPRVCALTGKKVVSGNNVSHAVNRTKRTFQPNLQSRRLYSDALGTMVRLRVTTNALRSVDKAGGIDAFLLSTKDSVLSQDALVIKRRVKAKTEAAAA
ncbi:MAG: 50S ribosomal protein L28 [Pseudomonadota bacterium]